MPQTIRPDLAALIATTIEHYAPSVSLHNEADGDRLDGDHVQYCLGRIREIAQENTGEIQVPSGFEYIDADGGERWGDLTDPDIDPDILRAGLAYAAAQAAALQLELARVTNQGIAFLRLLDEAGTTDN